MSASVAITSLRLSPGETGALQEGVGDTDAARIVEVARGSGADLRLDDLVGEGVHGRGRGVG